MNNTTIISDNLLSYSVKAKNSATESENRIHDDEVARQYGFRGGLVPGVTVYGYMTVPLVERFGVDWLARGSMQVRFHKPFYEGEEVFVKGEIDQSGEGIRVSLRAEREDGEVCSTALAAIRGEAQEPARICIEDYSESPLPSMEERPSATREAFVAGFPIGTLIERLSLPDTVFLDQMDEPLRVYRDDGAIAHPAFLLGLSNQTLVRNFKLGPWIHVASDLINRSMARDGETISVRGRIEECFEKKGHEFVVVDLLVVAGERRIVQQVRHTAIYRPKIV